MHTTQFYYNRFDKLPSGGGVDSNKTTRFISNWNR